MDHRPPAQPLATAARLLAAATAALACWWGVASFQQTRERLEGENAWWLSTAKEYSANLRSREVELRRAGQLDPTNALARFELAQLLVSTEIDKMDRGDRASMLPERLDEADELLDEIAATFPDPALMERLRGELLLVRAQLARAARQPDAMQVAAQSVARLESAYDLRPQPQDSANPRQDRGAFYVMLLRAAVDSGRDDLAADVLMRLERDNLRPRLLSAPVRDAALQAWFLLGAFHQIGRELYFLLLADPRSPFLADRFTAGVTMQDLGPLVFATLDIARRDSPLPPALERLHQQLLDERMAAGLAPPTLPETTP